MVVFKIICKWVPKFVQNTFFCANGVFKSQNLIETVIKSIWVLKFSIAFNHIFVYQRLKNGFNSGKNIKIFLCDPKKTARKLFSIANGVKHMFKWWQIKNNHTALGFSYDFWTLEAKSFHLSGNLMLLALYLDSQQHF